MDFCPSVWMDLVLRLILKRAALSAIYDILGFDVNFKNLVKSLPFKSYFLVPKVAILDEMGTEQQFETFDCLDFDKKFTKMHIVFSLMQLFTLEY